MHHHPTITIKLIEFLLLLFYPQINIILPLHNKRTKKNNIKDNINDNIKENVKENIKASVKGIIHTI